MIERPGSGSVRYLWLTDPDPDPGGPKTYGSDGSGSTTLVQRYLFQGLKVMILLYVRYSRCWLRSTWRRSTRSSRTCWRRTRTRIWAACSSSSQGQSSTDRNPVPVQITEQQCCWSIWRRSGSETVVDPRHHDADPDSRSQHCKSIRVRFRTLPENCQVPYLNFKCTVHNWPAKKF